MYTLNGWWFLSSGGSYPPVFTVVLLYIKGAKESCAEHQSEWFIGH